MQKFREHVFPDTDRHVMAQAPKNEANAIYWFEHELRQYLPVGLDLNTLTGRGDPDPANRGPGSTWLSGP